MKFMKQPCYSGGDKGISFLRSVFLTLTSFLPLSLPWNKIARNDVKSQCETGRNGRWCEMDDGAGFLVHLLSLMAGID